MTTLPPLPESLFPVDRDGASRDNPDLFDLLWANPQTRVLPVHRGRVLLEIQPTQTGANSQASLRLFEVDQISSASFRVYLGKVNAMDGQLAGAPIVLAALTDNSATLLEPDSELWHDVRKSRVALNERDSALYLSALAMTNFHQNHIHCSHCGKPTMIQQGGWSRRCFDDNRQTFPRTDPAVIVAVSDHEDRILLGSQGVWEENRWSILAGFVEAGESLTAAAVREVEEESGVRIGDLEYVGSQAWPFPNSLMVGFRAKADPSVGVQQPTPDGVELVKVRWFTRTEIREGLAAGNLILPGPITIARVLIEDWFGGPYDVA